MVIVEYISFADKPKFGSAISTAKSSFTCSTVIDVCGFSDGEGLIIESTDFKVGAGVFSGVGFTVAVGSTVAVVDGVAGCDTSADGV